ncbi:MAG: type II secretion system protein GspM [Pseudoxanthomonas sp.]
MTPAYPERERWLALGLLLLVLAVAYVLLIHPWWTVPMRQASQRIEQLRERELRIRTQLQQAPEVQRRLADARALSAQQPGFLAEPSAELATAGLVKRLEAVVAEASPGNRSCAIQNRSPQPQTGAPERFQRVTVNVRLLCGAPQLATVLHALEGGSPRLFIDDLDMLSQRYSFVGQAGSSNSGLLVTFNLSGYLQPRAPIATAAPGPDAAGGADAR